jgi:hypothetical protein
MSLDASGSGLYQLSAPGAVGALGEKLTYVRGRPPTGGRPPRTPINANRLFHGNREALTRENRSVGPSDSEAHVKFCSFHEQGWAPQDHVVGRARSPSRGREGWTEGREIWIRADAVRIEIGVARRSEYGVRCCAVDVDRYLPLELVEAHVPGRGRDCNVSAPLAADRSQTVVRGGIRLRESDERRRQQGSNTCH